MSESAGPTMGEGDSPFPAAYGSVGAGGADGADAPARPVRAPRTRSARTATADPAEETASRRRARPARGGRADDVEQGAPDAASEPAPRPRRSSSGSSRRPTPVLPPGPPPSEPPPTEVPRPLSGPVGRPPPPPASGPDTAVSSPSTGEVTSADWSEVDRPARPARPPLRNRVRRQQPTDPGDWSATPSDLQAREVARQYAPDAEISLGPERRWGRRRVTVMRTRVDRRMLRRIDTWTVFKMSFFFYLLLLVIVMVAGVVTWFVAQRIGFVGDIQKSVRSLADDRSFILHGGPVFEYSLLGGAVLAVAGTLLNTIGAMLYNLLSDLVGGVQTIVVTEPD